MNLAPGKRHEPMNFDPVGDGKRSKQSHGKKSRIGDAITAVREQGVEFVIGAGFRCSNTCLRPKKAA